MPLTNGKRPKKRALESVSACKAGFKHRGNTCRVVILGIQIRQAAAASVVGVFLCVVLDATDERRSGVC